MANVLFAPGRWLKLRHLRAAETKDQSSDDSALTQSCLTDLQQRRAGAAAAQQPLPPSNLAQIQKQNKRYIEALTTLSCT